MLLKEGIMLVSGMSQLEVLYMHLISNYFP